MNEVIEVPEANELRAVKIHCGSAHVASSYGYRVVVASLFVSVRLKSGKLVWRNSGRYVGPFRSEAKCEREGRAFAKREGAEFIPGYGSLHNVPIPEDCEVVA